ncbi:HEAT repeat domain-containing protein [Streptomyces sp. SA15]|uniref:HEAT repeat domain-containing protein n=1 Tax=Streptomyces sp. SA15 TaxID=934019 RepID=UPI00211C58A7|nr:HEAT repeat domain-containing protein [Streptomyces sp. SA15]
MLDLFIGCEHPDQEAIGLRYVDHPDPRVRREVPYALSTYATYGTYAPLSPAARAALLTLTRDPDADVRIAACREGMRDDELLPEIIRALLLMVEDPDAGTRGAAASVLAASRARTPAVADALAALIDDDEQLVRLDAAYGLARRDDPRTEEAIERVGPLGAGFEHDHRPHEFWRWRERMEGSDNPPAG